MESVDNRRSTKALEKWYAVDEAARLAVRARDEAVGCICYQESTKSYWRLDGITPYVWVLIGTELVTTIPSTSTSTGIKGQRAIDTTNHYVYECIDTNLWVRFSYTAF